MFPVRVVHHGVEVITHTYTYICKCNNKYVFIVTYIFCLLVIYFSSSLTLIFMGVLKYYKTVLNLKQKILHSLWADNSLAEWTILIFCMSQFQISTNSPKPFQCMLSSLKTENLSVASIFLWVNCKLVFISIQSHCNYRVRKRFYFLLSSNETTP